MLASRRGPLALMRSMDLHFEDAQDEADFVISMERHRLQHLMLMGTTAFFVLGWIALNMVASELQQDHARLRWAVWDGRWLFASLAVAVITLAGVLVAVAAFRMRGLSRYAGHSERLVAALYLGLILWLCFCRHYHVMLMVQEPDSGYADRVGGGYTNAVLGLVGAITSLCMSSSVRLRRLVALVSLSWSSWLVSFIAFGPEDENSSPVVTLLALLALHGFGLQGAWRNERYMRMQWRQLQALRQQSAMACGMQAVAERFCSFVLTLRDDLRVCVEDLAANRFFGRPSLGQSFFELVGESDKERVTTVLSQASSTHIPICLQVSLSAVSGYVEANLFIADTGASNPRYIVGVSVEQADGERIDAPLRPEIEADLEGRPSKPRFADDEGSTFTGRIFGGPSLERIADLGREEHWRIPAEELRLPMPACILGRGSFGVVAAGVLHGRAAAVKTVSSGTQDQRCFRALLDELRVLRRIRHPNVVLFHGAVVEPGAGSVALVYELIRGMQLDVVVKRTDPSRLNRFRMLYDISNALYYLHVQAPPIIHSDLKGSNIMVEDLRSGFRAKVIDFGLSKFLARGAKAEGGSLGWSPPERFIHAGGADSVSADVFSFGWLVHLAITGEGPYGDARGEALESAVAAMVLSGRAPAPPLPGSAPWRAQCEALCRECFAFDPAARPSMEVAQQRLKAWLTPEDVVELDFVSATAMLDSVSWLEGECELQTAEDEQTCSQIDFDASDGFRVTFAEAASEAQALPEVGESFLDWLPSPDNFRISTWATLNDMRSGILVAPFVQSVSGLDLRPPTGARPTSRASGVALFPAQGGMVSLRLYSPRRADGGVPKVCL